MYICMSGVERVCLSLLLSHLLVHDISSHDVFLEDRPDVDVAHGDGRLAFFPQKLLEK